VYSHHITRVENYCLQNIQTDIISITRILLYGKPEIHPMDFGHSKHRLIEEQADINF